MSSYRRRLMLANQTEENIILYGNSVQDGTPTPDAPIDIMSVENPTIKVTGENLISPYTLYEGLNNYQEGIDEETGRKYIRFIDNKLKQFNWSFKENTQYTVSAWVKATIKNNDNTQQSHFLYFWYTDGTTSMAKVQRDSDWTFVSHTSTKGKTIQSIGMFTYNYVNYVYVDVDTFMFNEGTEALPYEPYEEELITIDETTPFGTNLIPTYTGADYQGSQYTCTHNGDGTFVINGTGNGSSYATCCTIVGKQLNNLLINGETYTFSLNCSDITITSALLVIRYREISSGADKWYSNNLSKCTRFTVNKDVYDYQQLYIQINPNTQTFTNVIVKPMLAHGYYTELPFEQYIPPITTMRGIGDYKDRIYTKDGKVWFEQNVKSISLADENYNTYGSGLDMVYTKNNIDIPISYYAEGMCNLYKVLQPPNGAENILDNNVVIGRKDKKIYIRDFVNATTSTTFNSWIKTVESELIHPSANPIITEITGALADKILAIDKSKNITIYSDNGVCGNTEIVED